MSNEKTCIRCKFLRMRDDAGGRCRHGRTPGRESLPEVALDHRCDHWQDGGQQYFIRLGWLEALRKEQEAASGVSRETGR